jgi:hypothetical protein
MTAGPLLLKHVKSEALLFPAIVVVDMQDCPPVETERR